MAVKLKSHGWKAIKLRAHYQRLKEDVRLVAVVRKTVGREMVSLRQTCMNLRVEAGKVRDAEAGGGLTWAGERSMRFQRG